MACGYVVSNSQQSIVLNLIKGVLLMSIRSRGLVFAMEEGELGNGVDAEVVPAAQADAEAATAEVVEQAGEVEEITTAVEEAAADAETLGDISDVMQETVDSGEGMDETAAAVTEVAVEAICARLGMRGRNSIPALESFGSANSRLAATKVAIESISEKIKTVLEAIKKAFISMWEKIKNFFFNFFNNAEKIEKLSGELKKKVSEIGADLTAKEKEFKSSSIATALNDGSKVDFSSVNDILSTHASMASGFKDTVRDFSAIGDAAKQAAEGIARGITFNTIDQAAGLIGSDFEKLGGTDSKDKAPEGATVVAHKEINKLAGNEKLVLLVSTKDSKTDIKLTVEKRGDFSKESVAVLTKEEMTKVCDSVSSLMKNTAEIKKEISKVEATNKSFIAVIDAIIKHTSATVENEEAKKNINALKALVVSGQAASTRFATYVPTANVRAGKAALNYVSASMKEYKKEEK